MSVASRSCARQTLDWQQQFQCYAVI